MIGLLFAVLLSADGGVIPPVRRLDTPYPPPSFASAEVWKARAEALRTRVLVSAGLWPPPPRPPLRPRVFGRSEHGGYTVEKVVLESLPGVYVTGNLYRPRVEGRVPAILNAHGHFTWGRLENGALASHPARAASFARQGYVAFAWDMVGYGDSRAIPHGELGSDRDALWGLSALGVQLANAQRALDFVLSLPEVDPARVGMTGESGGGTQTFLLTAVDERVRAAAPVVMVSAHMQGGCVCENAPGLRIDASNVEIAALAAPRPMMLVSATGDWTKNTPTVEFPAIRAIYALLGAGAQVENAHFDAPHNYDRRSREAVYGFFARAFAGRREPGPVLEPVSHPPPPADLMVYWGAARPREVDAAGLRAWWEAMARRQLAEAAPRDAASLARHRERFGTALKVSVGARPVEPTEVTLRSDGAGTHLARGDARVPVTVEGTGPRWVVVADGEASLARALAARGFSVASVRTLAPRPAPPRDARFFATYNPTEARRRVQALLTAIAFARGRGAAEVSLVGAGEAGLAALLARAYAPGLARTVVDAEGFAGDDEAFLARLAIPGLRRAGDLTTAALLDTDGPLLIHDTRGRSPAAAIGAAMGRVGRGRLVVHERAQRPDAAMADWLAAPTPRT